MDKIKQNALEKVEKKNKVKKKKDITIKANKKGRHVIPFMNFLRILLLPIFYLIFPCRFYGNKKIKDGPCLYISNHKTLLDIVYPATTPWEGVHYVAKNQLSTTPVVGAVARKCKTIFVNRDGSDVRALLDCFKCLKNGDKIIIFPEGTRNKTSEIMLPFKQGAAVMAIKTKTPVVPIVVYSKTKAFRCTHVLIGEPMELSEYYDKKLSEEELAAVDNMLRDKLIAMHKEHTEYLEAKKKKGKKA